MARSWAICFKVGVSPEVGLAAMTAAEQDALILLLLPLVGQREAALAGVAMIEARIDELTRPPKTPDNSSTRRLKRPPQPAGLRTGVSHYGRDITDRPGCRAIPVEHRANHTASGAALADG